MKKIGVDVYKINELSSDIRQKVIDRNRYEYLDCANYDIQDDFSQILEQKGYPTNDIRYSLSYCQGDGVAFYGDIDLENFIEKRYSELEENLSKHDLRRIRYIAKQGLTIDIRKSSYFHNCDHYNTMIVEVVECVENYMYEYAKQSDIEEMISSVYELEKFISDDVKLLSRELESIGYDIIETYTSDDYIVEGFELSEVYFTKEGKYIDINSYEEIV